MATKAIHAVGKRKTSIARVYLKPGKGKITINKRDIEEYYLRATSKMVVRQPLELTGNVDKYDILVNVMGGGLSGQAGAIRHALSRALSELDPEYRKVLKAQGLITRDSRKKERKMYGLKSARARFQFSKR
ncbi:MAG TPA: 30S ribosomal protein S9 [Oligoflexus sp.]|uniref:30S ribosomal protein S9 n=1 Tax=Oligoflexus sp. TaxID=1971216 RepID=UPI002D7085B4|nr:30S ribosomal protein S9 [Oligoflexus sp.]HYX32569.1 30S ribosomal protein S9 [Oligoflexus sp.]